jgi:prefoldin subunit 5
MTDSNLLELRLQDVTKDLAEIGNRVQSLDTNLTQLNLTLSLLEQTVKTITALQEERRQFSNRVQYFIIGGFISAAVAFILGGGLIL